jgi:ABC-2 type transport system ATP-binding protein
MSTVIEARGLTKAYGQSQVLNGIDLNIEKGRIVGLIGPNGAGKTTALRCLLGLSSFDGNLDVLGLDPRRDRTQLLEDVCFIADTAILPQWLKVSQAIEFLKGVHPNFNLEKAQSFLASTNIEPNKKISQLSKGMITQLHLALVMAIDVKLLVLDEPTLGLDILYRKQFYTSLLNDYFDEERTIIVTTHQVEEVEGLLTDLLFIKDGRIILETEMEDIDSRFVELEVRGDDVERAKALGPISERKVLGGSAFIFEGESRDNLAEMGKLRTPSVADLFVAKMQA